MKRENFKSKILLFGEYSLIHNSMGLSIPFDFYKGKLAFSSANLTEEEAKASNESLRKYAAFLRIKVEEGSLGFRFDIDALERDVERGLIFDSTIPQGFGVGSSGALVAALYDRYVFDKIYNDESITGEQIITLKNHLAAMESYFHGTSSGIDPLICYLEHPLLIRNKTAIDAVGIPESRLNGKGGIFLINTGTPGNTKPLVNLFLEKCKKEKGFLRLLKKEMIPFNNNCIKAFMKGETRELLTNVKDLSRFLLSYLTPMIPGKFRKVWERGLETESYYLKLCGSGGGGYLLGFTEDIEKAKKELADYSITVIHRF